MDVKMIALIVLALTVAAAGAFAFLASKSKTGAAPGLVDGRLAACPASPNCVSSEAGTPDSHAVAPLPSESWDRLAATIEAQGGKNIARRDDYMAAAFKTKLMGYVDDVEFRKAEGAVHVRSASRVGHSDLGANRKRVEALRAALSAYK